MTMVKETDPDTTCHLVPFRACVDFRMTSQRKTMKMVMLFLAPTTMPNSYLQPTIRMPKRQLLQKLKTRNER